MSAVAPARAGTWTPVCRLAQLGVESGAAALLDGVQVALFRTHEDEVLAIGNRDPFTGAQVLSRGIVGTRGEVTVVASPMLKQAFDLRTGSCLDDERVSVPVFPTRVVDGVVHVLTEEAAQVRVQAPQ